MNLRTGVGRHTAEIVAVSAFLGAPALVAGLILFRAAVLHVEGRDKAAERDPSVSDVWKEEMRSGLVCQADILERGMRNHAIEDADNAAMLACGVRVNKAMFVGRM